MSRQPNVLDSVPRQHGSPYYSSDLRSLTSSQRRVLERHENEAQQSAACTRRIFSERVTELENSKKTIDLEICQNYCRFAYPDSGYITGGDTRGKITGFSSAARRRQIQDFASLKEYPRMWLDLTFADDVMAHKNVGRRAEYSSDCIKRWKSEAERLLLGLWGVWKREWEPRKSGMLVGEFCPHFHVMLDYPALTQENHHAIAQKLLLAWVRITATLHPAAYKVALNEKSYRWVLSKNMAQKYVTKYMAKCQDLENADTMGRFWGRIGDPPYGEKVRITLTDMEQIWLKRLLPKLVRKTSKRTKRTRRNLRRGMGFILISKETLQRLLDYIRSGALEFKTIQEPAVVTDCPF